jgi:uncharacterized protein
VTHASNGLLRTSRQRHGRMSDTRDVRADKSGRTVQRIQGWTAYGRTSLARVFGGDLIWNVKLSEWLSDGSDRSGGSDDTNGSDGSDGSNGDDGSD